MAAKTTFVSGFHFTFVFYALDLVENEYNIDGLILKTKVVFCELWGIF